MLQMDTYEKHACFKCGKVHNTRQAKHSHQKICQSTGLPHFESEVIRLTAIVGELQVQKDELQVQNEELQMQKVEWHKQKDELQRQNAELRNNKQVSTSNVTNNNIIVINQNITVNAFGREKFPCEKDVNDFVCNLIKQRDLYKSLQEMIRFLHFNSNHPENMNVYIKNNKMTIKVKAGWRCETFRNASRSLACNALDTMNTFFDETKYTPEQVLRWQNFHRTVDQETRVIDQTQKTIMESEAIVNEYCPEPQTCF